MKNVKVQLFGNVGKAEAQYTPQGQFIFKGSIATSHGKRGEETTNWYNFTAWETLGEWMNKSVEKGTYLYIEGSLVLREWTDKEGVVHISPDVTVTDYRVLGRGKKKEESEEEEPEFMQD